MKDPGTGIHRIAREQYDRLDRVNWSTLKLLAKSPAHYRHRLFGQDEDTDGKKLGRCTHMAVLEPERFRSAVAVWTGERRAGNAWEEFREENEGRELLREGEHAHCLALQAAVHRDPLASRYLAGGRAEQSLLWTRTVPPGPGVCPRACEPIHPKPLAAQKCASCGDVLEGVAGYNIDIKSMVDFISNAGCIVDLKTTRNASPLGFGKECWNYRYDAQAALYVDGYRAVTGKDVAYIIVAVESEQPHVVQVYRIPDHVLEVGREHYRTLLDTLNLCRSESRWPTYADGELELQLPRWAVRADDDDASDFGLIIGGESAQEHA